MKFKLKRAQAILEYIILFGVLAVAAGVTLVAVYNGSGDFQNGIKAYLEGS